MNIKRLAPWNWFKDEQESGQGSGSALSPSSRTSVIENDPFLQMRRDVDRVFESIFPGRFWGGSLFPRSSEMMPSGGGSMLASLRPSIDIEENEKEYTATIELPGVAEEDVQLEIVDQQLIIRGEKRREEEKSERNYHRVERSYGSFQRVLSLPEDVDQDAISADFRNGVVTLHLPRRAIEEKKGRRIDLKKAA